MTVSGPRDESRDGDHKTASPSRAPETDEPGWRPTYVPGWRIVYALDASLGPAPTGVFADPIPLADSATAPKSWTCECPTSTPGMESPFAKVTPRAEAACGGATSPLILGAGTCSDVHFPEGYPSLAPAFVGDFASVDVSAAPSTTGTLRGFVEGAPEVAVGVYVYAHSPFPFGDDPLDRTILDCQLREGIAACPDGYPNARTLVSIDDRRVCECDATVTHASPRLELFSGRNCQGSPSSTIALTDASCTDTASASAESVRFRVDATVTIPGTFTKSGTIETHVSTLCCH